MILLVALLMPSEPVRADADGIPLPPGAVARLGSVRFRVTGYSGYVSPDGRTLFTLRTDDDDKGRHHVSATDTASGRPLYAIDLPDARELVGLAVRVPGVMTCDYLTEDGTLLARRFDAATGFPLGRSEPLGRSVQTPVRLSPGRAWVVETYLDVCRRAGIDETDQVVRVRAVGGDGPPRELLRHRDAGEFAEVAAAVSADERLVAAADRGPAIRLFDPRTGREGRPIALNAPERAAALTFLPDGRLAGVRVAGGKAAVVVWDVTTGRPRTLYAFPGLGYFPPPEPLAGGRRLAVRCDDEYVVLDTATGKPVWAGRRSPFSITFAADGRTAYVHRVGWVTPTDVATGEPTHARDETGPARRLAFLADGRLAVRYDGGTRVWDREFRASRPGPEPPRPAGNPRWSPDGRLTVPLGSRPGTRVLEAASGRPRFTLPEVGVGFDEFAFSPDGRHLATHERDGIVLVWDLRRDVSLDPPTPAALAAAVADLGSPDAEAGLRAIRLLAEFPDRSLPALRAALPPAAVVPADRVADLIADLDAPRFADRRDAARELAALGTEVAPALRVALKATPSAEVRSRLEPLLAGTLSADELRTERAVEAAEWMATPAADALLARWAGGAAGRRLTVAAAAAASRRGCAPRTGAGPADR